MYMLLFVLSLLYGPEAMCSSTECQQKFAYTLKRTKKVSAAPGTLMDIETHLLNDEGDLLVYSKQVFRVENQNNQSNISLFRSSGVSDSFLDSDDSQTMQLLYYKACQKYLGDKKDCLHVSFEHIGKKFHFNGSDFPEVFKSEADQQKKRSVPVITQSTVQ